MMWSRRAFGQKLFGALIQRGGGPLLDRMPGMLSAAYIMRRGAAVRRRAEGRALTRGRWRDFTLDQPFRVASPSKMLAATGFMALARQNDLDLDADVSVYLGEPLRHPAFPAIALTPRMLLSHASGLRNGIDFPVPFNRPLLARLSAAAREDDYGGWFAPAHEPPGRWFSYSDTNFALIAQIVERVSGARFDRFMREALFAPLRLDIGYNWSGVSTAKRARAAAACVWQESAWRPQVDAAPPRAPEIVLYRGENNGAATEADYRIGMNGFAFAPQGGLRLSVADMDRLAQFYLDGARAGDETLAPMTTPAWVFDPASPNGDTLEGFYQAFGLGVQTPLGRPAQHGLRSDAYFGAGSADWRGHFGDAYGWMTGLFWNARANATLVWAINGMPEADRPQAARTALTAAEEAVIDSALDR
jgi:D-alanyl-D-alanine carboxypeptidase